MIPPILVTGCARSGTSMTTGGLVKSGAKGGEMYGPNRYNPRGMFENRIIREGVVKPYLRSIGADPRGQKPLPRISLVWKHAEDAGFVEQWKMNIHAIMRAQGVGDVDVWVYKGAKICLFWPLWHAAFPEAKWVIVRRTDRDIINSCLRTRFMNSYKNAEGWQEWIDSHKERFSEMHDAGLDILEMWPEKVIGGEVEIYYNMIRWAGLTPPDDLVETFIDPVLWGKKK